MKRTLRQRTVALFTLAGGIALSAAAWYATGRLIENEARSDFVSKAQFGVGLIERRVQRYLDLLYGLEGLFGHDSTVTRAEFHGYVGALDVKKRFSGVQAIEFIRRVPGVDRDRFIAQVRGDHSISEQGYPEFTINPPGERAEYFVVDFVEPAEGNAPAFGMDVFTRTAPHQAMERARDTGEPISTGRYRLVQDTADRPGMVVYLPVYRGNREVRSIAERRADLIGYVNAVFRLDDLLADVIDENLRNLLHGQITDEGPTGNGMLGGDSGSGVRSTGAALSTLLYSTTGTSAIDDDGKVHDSRYQYSEGIEVAGRRWRVSFHSAMGDGNPWLQPLALTAPGVGLIITALLLAVMRTIWSSRHEAVRTAREATHDLREQLSFSRQLLEAMPNPVFVKDTAGRYIVCNRAFEELTGLKRADLIGKTIDDIASPEMAREHALADAELLASPGARSYDTAISYGAAGEIHDAIFNKATFFQADGTVVGIVGVIVDISERKGLERSISDSNQRLQSIIEASPLAIIARDFSAAIRIWNPAAERLFGWKAEEVLGTNTTIVPDDLREETLRLRGRAERGEMLFLDETRRMHKDGRAIDVSVSVAPVYDAQRRPNGTMVVIADITARKKAEAALRESEAQLRLAMEAANMGSWYWDLINHHLTCSDGLGPLFGLLRGQFYATFPEFLASFHADDRELVQTAVHRALKQSDDFNLECRIVWPDGSVHWIFTQGHVFRAPDRRAVRIIGVATDITDRKRAEQRIAYMAHHDALTGLPNRVLLRDRIGQAIARAHRAHSQLAVLFIDLDRFKNVNDSLGHQAGDRLLQAVTSRIKTCLREGDTISRLGGDEFVIVLPDITGTQDTSAVANKILEVLSSSYHIQGQDLHVTASIGVSLYPSDGDDTDTLMRNADTAMYHAKDSGRANFQYFTAHLNVSAQQRLRLENDLRRAVERREFVLFYQPVYSAAGRRLVGVEALLRWAHPERGLVSPGEFLPIAEESGLIHRIGEWVLGQACRQAATWHRRGHLLHMAVNISANQLRRSTFTDRLRALLEDTGIDPALVELELTENVLMDGTDESLRMLNAIDALGVGLAVDDFGTGYSGLSYLKRFPIDTVKIDQSFVRDIAIDPDDAAIVRAIIAMAKSLKLEVIAEGVETEEQLTFLQALGCDMVQGFYLGAPMRVDDFEALLDGHERAAVAG